MRQCWKCRKRGDEVNIHHVNGNPEDEKPQNCLGLCKECHDLVQGICDKCIKQKYCFVQNLQRCWGFDDALPPLYFRDKTNIPPIGGQGEVKTSPVSTRALVGISMVTLLDESPLKCYLCGKENKRFNPEKITICSHCTLFLISNPRMKNEGFDEWKERLIT